MKLPAYLSPSRHGVYYFRWPLPTGLDGKRHTVKLSLKTKCPDRASDIARHLASYGKLLKDEELARLDRKELQAKVRAHFDGYHKRYLDCLNRKEPTRKLIADAREEMLDHESFLELESTFPQWLKIQHFKSQASISDEDWSDSQPMATNELRRGRIRLLRAVLEAVGDINAPVAGHGVEIARLAPVVPLTPLSEVVDGFMTEYGDRSSEMVDKYNKAFAVMLEYYGQDRPISDITIRDASDLQKVVLALPKRRTTRAETRDLSLLKAIEVKGLDRLHPDVINWQINAYKKLWGWAERHGYVEAVLFDGLTIDKANNDKAVREEFSKEQTKILFRELTENTSGHVRNEDYKWGTLVGMFTGARVTEVGQLKVSDIRQDKGIWYFDINGDSEGNKVKSKASKRRIPIHAELIRLGLLDFVKDRPQEQRLFLACSNNRKNGYGRNLSRFFNDRFLPRLGMKQDELVFHSFRHTMIDRLTDAGVDEPLVQFIIGQKRTNVTQAVYNKKGYAIPICKQAIDKFMI